MNELCNKCKWFKNNKCIHVEGSCVKIDTDGRRPNSVTFSTMEEDAKRRDFTCNALFYDPIADKIYDFVGGQDDIKNKILRFVGNPDDRIDEDKLRILRFIRFAIKLEFPTVDFLSYTAVRGNGINIKQIAPERIREEIVKCLEYRHPHSFLHLLSDTHILWYIFPDIAMLENEEQDPKWHPEGNCYVHIFKALELVRDESYIIKLATLFHDVGKPATHKVVDGRITTRGHHKVGADITRKALEELRFSNEEIEHICWLVYNHMVNPIKLKTSKLKKLLAHPYIEDLIKVMRADKASSHGDTSHADFLEKKLNEWTPEEIKPSALVTGHDLIEFGFKPGPLFKEILNEVVDLQLENKINNKEEAIGHIKRKFQTNMSI